MKTKLIVHPLLFAIAPIFLLYSHNAVYVPFSDVFLPCVASVVLSVLLWSLTGIFLRDWQKSAIVSSLFVLLFLSFGYIYDAIRYFHIGEFKVGRAGYIIIAIVVLTIIVTTSLAKSRKNFQHLTRALNFVAAFLVVSSVFTAVSEVAATKELPVEKEVHASRTALASALPDIYYIVLDAHGRADILEEFYEYDSSEFIGALSGHGFYIAGKSNSNYCRTMLSLTSALNMVYLDELSSQVGRTSKDLFPLINMLKYNKVANFLRKQGYDFVTFSTGFSKTEIRNADIYLSRPGLLSEFQNVLLNTTPVPVILKEVIDQHELHRQRLLFTFKSLTELPDTDSPKFVFAHILSPHAPFVFGENGQPLKSDRPFYFRRNGDRMNESEQKEYRGKYRAQLSFINKKVAETVSAIIEKSDNPPIIIIQGDHGPASMLDYENLEETFHRERMAILNAYYFPEEIHKKLTPDISPVNTFRLVLNHYFATDYEPLENRSYYSTWSQPYEYFDVTDRLSAE